MDGNLSCWRQKGYQTDICHSSCRLVWSACPLVCVTPHLLIRTSDGPAQSMQIQPEQLHSCLWASVTHLRMDLYLQHRTRKQLVNPFSLRPLICSYLLQHPEKSQGIFSSLFPIDPTLRNSAPLSKHYWSPPSQRQALTPVYKRTGWIEISFPTTCSCYFYPLFPIVGNKL